MDTMYVDETTEQGQTKRDQTEKMQSFDRI